MAAVSGLLGPGDLCLTLGAGDLTSLPDELMAAGEPGASEDAVPVDGRDLGPT